MGHVAGERRLEEAKAQWLLQARAFTRELVVRKFTPAEIASVLKFTEYELNSGIIRPAMENR